MKKIISIVVFFFPLWVLGGYVFAQKDIQKKIQTQFIMAENGSTILLDEGSFTFTASLSLEGKKNITIKGKGKDKTKAILYDISDDCTYNSRKNYTLNHLIERIKIYNEENFNYEIITIQLKK
jgi:hypothetical protein